jgi:3-deoxy-D-manno-octulosonic-acid transferase
MHKLYTIISYLLIPFILINTYLRVFRNKEDKNRYKERFGLTNIKSPIKRCYMDTRGKCSEFNLVTLYNIFIKYAYSDTTTKLLRYA